MKLNQKFNNLETFKIFSIWLTRLIVLLVVTGGVVRLTESGLGCADWPNCTKNSFIAPLKYHSLVEDGNRFIVSIVSVFIVLNFVWALILGYKFAKFTSGIILGLLISQIFMGALVVYSHLYPPFVMLHFFLSILMIIAGVIQLHISSQMVNLQKTGRGKQIALTSSAKHNLKLLSNTLIFLLLTVVIIGTAVSGSGPHSGSIGSKRLPISYIKIAFVHIGSVTLLFFCLIALLNYLNSLKFPKSVTKWGYFSIEIVITQAVIGLIQLLLHSPALVVGIHLFMACAVVSVVFEFVLLVKDHINSDHYIYDNKEAIGVNSD